jgi:hypothetical protein
VNRKLRNIVWLEKALVNIAYHKKYVRAGLRVSCEISLDRDTDFIIVRAMYTNRIIYKVSIKKIG